MSQTGSTNARTHAPPSLPGGPAQGPLAVYRERLKTGVIDYDQAQEEAIERFQTLYEALKHYRPETAGGLGGARGLWSFFGSGPDREVPRGLYLCGDVGRGKSMVMDLFYETAPLETKRRVHFHAFMQEIHAAIARWRALDEAEQRRRLRALGLPTRNGADPLPPVARQVAREAHLLCFDELQVTDVADAMILGRLFTALFDNGVVVVCTTNRSPQSLYQGGINRQLFLPFIDLIEERLDILHLDGAMDYRQERIKGRPVYYTPLDEAADEAMDKAWRDLTDTARGNPCEVEVLGRRLPVPQAAKGTARFTFADLCEQPLGPPDYLSLAARFHTILLDAIPQLGPSKRNEAKRFVTLIDTLYEAKITLIASAEAEPEVLYPQGDGSFEFARTASRLAEMQSADYIAAARRTGRTT